jgi:hypothetical protein
MDTILKTTTWDTATDSLNGNFTTIQGLIDAINTSLGAKALQTDVTTLTTQLNQLQSLVTSTASDPDSVVSTIQEVLQAFSQFPEGTSVATALSGKVDKTLTINGKALNTNLTFVASDFGIDLSQYATVTQLANKVDVITGSTLLSSQQAADLAAIKALILAGDDQDTFINTFNEVLKAFQNEPEGFDIAGALAAKLDNATFTAYQTTVTNLLSGKQATLTFDAVPTQGSINPVTSGGVYNGLSAKQNILIYDTVLASGGANLIKSGDIYNQLLSGGGPYPNLVTNVYVGNVYSSSGALTGSAGLNATNKFPATANQTFTIQGLTQNNVANSAVGRAFKADGSFYGTIVKSQITAITGGFLLTITNDTNIASIGLFFEDAGLPIKTPDALIIRPGTSITNPAQLPLKVQPALLPNNGIQPFKVTDLANDSELVSIADVAAIAAIPDAQRVYFNNGAQPKTVSAKAPCFLSAGQSNQDGRIAIASLPAWWATYGNQLPNCIINNNDVLNWHTYNTGEFISGATFSYELLLYKMILDNQHAVTGHTSDNIYVIKKTLGSTSIDPTGAGAGAGSWSADISSVSGVPAILPLLETRIRAAQSSTNAALYNIDALIWHQGEADRGGYASAYYAGLKNMIYYVRGITGKPNLPVILGAINTASVQYSSVVEAAKMQLASENPTSIFYAALSNNTTANLNSDVLHFNYAGGLDLATSMFNIMTANKSLFGLL